MFSSKKDEEIKQLKSKHKEKIFELEKQIDSLKSDLMFKEINRADYQKLFDDQHAEFDLFKQEMQEREDYFNTEIARLRRMVAAEKNKRINSACANRRRKSGRKKH